MSALTATRLRELLHYEPETGVFTWRVKRSRTPAGARAGRTNRHGYRQIQIDRTLYSAHRLAWLYVNGEWPAAHIDHINRSRDDNRIANLRDVACRENHQNTATPKANTSGHKGVTRARRRAGWWQARIKHDGHSHYLGQFATVEEAARAYAEAASRLHTRNPAAA